MQVWIVALVKEIKDAFVPEKRNKTFKMSRGVWQIITIISHFKKIYVAKNGSNVVKFVQWNIIHLGFKVYHFFSCDYEKQKQKKQSHNSPKGDKHNKVFLVKHFSVLKDSYVRRVWQKEFESRGNLVGKEPSRIVPIIIVQMFSIQVSYFIRYHKCISSLWK